MRFCYQWEILSLLFALAIVSGCETILDVDSNEYCKHDIRNDRHDDDDDDDHHHDDDDDDGDFFASNHNAKHC